MTSSEWSGIIVVPCRRRKRRRRIFFVHVRGAIPNEIRPNTRSRNAGFNQSADGGGEV